MAETQPSTLVEDDSDSAYGEGDAESDTTSLKSAVTNYIYENGRRYNSFRSGSYWYKPSPTPLCFPIASR